MVNSVAPRLSKWPFFLGDLLLLGFAGLVIYFGRQPLGLAVIVASGLAVLAGAWLSVTPFLFEYRAAVKLSETDTLVSTVAQIQKLELVGDQVREATASWQSAHEMAVRTAETAKGITDRMVNETKAFKEFLQKTNEAEKGHLRLEVEKLRRAEGDWLQITTAMLDHIFALFQAGVRSGQPGLIDQLGHFQNACRDVARRVGLVPFLANPDEPFDGRTHQLIDAEAKPPAKAIVRHTLATGFLYQGQLLRRALVEIQPEPPVSVPTPEPAAEALSQTPVKEAAEAPAEGLPETPAEVSIEAPPAASFEVADEPVAAASIEVVDAAPAELSAGTAESAVEPALQAESAEPSEPGEPRAPAQAEEPTGTEPEAATQVDSIQTDAAAQPPADVAAELSNEVVSQSLESTIPDASSTATVDQRGGQSEEPHAQQLTIRALEDPAQNTPTATPPGTGNAPIKPPTEHELF